MSVTYPTIPKKNNPTLSVSQLNRLARLLLEENFPAVLVEGEISNFSVPASGHWYLTLKDANSQVRCAMFRNRNMLMRLRPKDGMKVLVKAKLSLYEGRGDYQLLLENMEERGAGALRQAFEILKIRLQQEGLFDAQHKKPLPALPRHIAVITSPTGAAIHDIISVLQRRFPAIEITIIPVAVQGVNAATEIISALQLVNSRTGCLHDVELILLGRGGGSLEDLWSFNDEGLARAIFASTLPVISAVGHDSDFTIADFVADVRAATPSAAAELISGHQDAYRQLLLALQKQLLTLIQSHIEQLQLNLVSLRKQLRHPGYRLQEQVQRLDELETRFKRAINTQLQNSRHHVALHQAGLLSHNPQRKVQQKVQQVQHLHQQLTSKLRGNLLKYEQQIQIQSRALHAVSPLATLARGYAIASTKNGAVITNYEQVEPGVTIHTRLDQGEIISTVVASHAQTALQE